MPKKKNMIIHNDSELWLLLQNDTYIWHPENFPKVKFSKEYLDRNQFEIPKKDGVVE